MRKVLYIFGLLSDADVQWIAKTGVLKRLRDGDVVIHEGEQTDSLIFILEGELAVSNLALGQFARMGVGEIVGEVSLVDSAPASATVTARGEGLALFLDKEMLMAKLAGDNGFGSRFYRALAVFLADRLREARRSPGNRSMGEADIADDDLDVGIVDRVSSAGDRFSQMLKTLQPNLRLRAMGLAAQVALRPACGGGRLSVGCGRLPTRIRVCGEMPHPDPQERALLDRRRARKKQGEVTRHQRRDLVRDCIGCIRGRSLRCWRQRAPRPRIIAGGLSPLASRLKHPCAIAQDRSVFTERQSA
jgi:CRP-like cAMP-binding protein